MGDGNINNLTSKGKRWVKGHSGNPSGRPVRMTTMFTDALREKLSVLDVKGKQTVAGQLADILIRCATDPDPEYDKTRIMALAEIVDRVEGRPKQQLDVNDVTADLRSRSTEDLVFHLDKGYWPEEEPMMKKRQKLLEAQTKLDAMKPETDKTQ